MPRKSPYSPEVRERAVKMVIEHRDEYPSEWAAMTSVATKLGMTAETLRRGSAGLRSTMVNDPASPPMNGNASRSSRKRSRSSAEPTKY